MEKTHRPVLFAFCGPTASGKSTVCGELIKQDPTLKLSISTTTRSPRPGETDRKDYFFVTQKEFEKKVAEGAFIEHAGFSGNSYGTETRNITLAAEAGCDLLLDIEIQGVARLKELYPDTVVTTFVFPKSFEELKQRLVDRGAETEEQIEMRLTTARQEVEVLRDSSFSDYLLINDKLSDSITNAQAIITAERQRMKRISRESLANVLKMQ